MSTGLPPGVYFATHYVDRQGRVENWHYYYEDGRVELVDEDGTLLVYRFEPQHIAELKQAIQGTGLAGASSLEAGVVHDAGAVTYSWSFDGQEGSVSNRAYPAAEHPAMARLDTVLARLEAGTAAR